MRDQHLAFAMLSLGLSVTLPAIGQINPFRTGPSESRLTDKDLDWFGASVAQLNSDPRLAVSAQKNGPIQSPEAMADRWLHGYFQTVSIHVMRCVMRHTRWVARWRQPIL
jgi:hypothetical protein